jgi:hypothetical protein
MKSKRVLTIREITLPDGMTKFVPEGQRGFDTAETLVRDGLIKDQRDKRGEVIGITLIEPDHPRVLAWVLGVNLACRQAGVPEAYPIPYQLVREPKVHSVQ